GDPDLVLMAPRSSPQLRLFRNDFAGGNSALAVRLMGTKSNRDAVGARVTVKTDQLRRTKLVQIGSGFLSQHSKELLFGLGKSSGTAEATIVWPSGLTQTVSGLPLNHRVWIEEGKGAVRTEPFRDRSAPSVGVDATTATGPAVPASRGTWLYEPFPAPDFTLKDLAGQERSRPAFPGLPAGRRSWPPPPPAPRPALEGPPAGRRPLPRP